MMRSGWLKLPSILARALRAALRRPSLDDLLPPLVAAAVFAFACGSSSVPSVTRVGHSLRWAALGVLLAAAALAQLQRRSLPPIRAATVAATAFVALGLVSAAWSVQPRISFERAVSLGLLFAVCILLAERRRPERLLDGVLAGAVAVALAGLVVLAAAHDRAVQPATYQGPARYQGFGQDPNTAALLLAVALPIAVWALLDARRPAGRALAGSALGLLLGTIVASGSRGGLFAAGVGSLVVIAARAGRSRATLVGAVAVVVLVLAGVGIQSLPKATSLAPPAPAAAAASAATAKPKPKPPQPRYRNADRDYPLDADIGQPLPGGGQPNVTRSFFGSSGRLDAWEGALHDAVRRPVAGHGFGTERDVFTDRYYRFVGGLPENSYLGLAIQLGIAGLLALAALVAVIARSALPALRGPRRGVVAAGLGVLAAGLAIGVVQSYLYSVGNLAAAALWIPAFVVAAVRDA